LAISGPGALSKVRPTMRPCSTTPGRSWAGRTKREPTSALRIAAFSPRLLPPWLPVGGVEVLVVEGAPLGHLGEVRARAHRQLRPRREQLGAGVRRDLEAARLQVDASHRHAVDREGAAEDLEGLLGRAQLALQRSDAQGSSSKTSMTS
jgi:hypothetical protein